jgi:uncharacterized protein
VRTLSLGFLCALSVLGSTCGGDSNTSPPSPTPAAPLRVLVVTHTEGFRHDSIPAAEAGIRDLGTESGLYTSDFCRTASDVRTMLTTDGLRPYQGVVFANTTGSLPIPDLPAFLSWIASGKGFVGIHSASDTYHDQPSFISMLGGEFVTHGAIVEAEVRVDEAAHPSVSQWAPTFRVADEFYRFQSLDPARRTLLSLARDPGDGAPAPAGVPQPLAWYKNHSTGRVFYTALGHRSELWQDARYRRHVLEGIRWAIRE